ncbi:MAG: hypothetical protein AAGJ81_10600 [Verrucomicrobiota bacterium]
MAGDWIKVEMTTPDKPEVVQMAARLDLDQDAVVGKLVRIWIWADNNSVDGNAVSVTSAFLNRIVFCQGFAEAMREVGWLHGDDGNLIFPNFDRHNGKTAKKRALANRRVADLREKKRFGNDNVTPEALQTRIPEKRREEYSTPPTPSSEGAEKNLALEESSEAQNFEKNIFGRAGFPTRAQLNRANRDELKAIIDGESTPVMMRLSGAVKNRSAGKRWSWRELKLLMNLGNLDREDLEVVEKYAATAAKGPDDKDYRKRDLATLLGDWSAYPVKCRGWLEELGDGEAEDAEEVPGVVNAV